MYLTFIGLLFAAKRFVICLKLCFFNIIWQHYVPGGTYDTCNDGTPLGSWGSSITFSRFVWINTVFALVTCLHHETSCLLHCSLPHNRRLLLLFSPMCMLHLLNCTYFNSAPIACPRTSVLT